MAQQAKKTSRKTSPARKTAELPHAASGTNPEELQREREESIRAIANQVIVGIVQTDLDGRLAYVNDRYCEITGYSREELIGKRWQEFTYPDDLSQNLNLFQQMFQTGDSYTFEKRYCRKDGEIIWVSVSSSLLHDRRDNPLGGVAIVVDISEQKKALEAVRESEKKYRLLFENSRDALLTNTPPDMHFTSANRAAIQMFRANSETEFLSLSPGVISPEFQPDGSPSMEKAKKMVGIALHEGSHLFEWMHRRMDGNTFWAEVMLTRMELDNQVFIQGTLRDISERKKLEREILERRNEMEDLQKHHIAAQTAAAIAHDLNQPLLAVASYCEAALMMLDAGQPNLDKLHKAIEGSEHQAHRAGQSIRELIEFLSVKDFPSEDFNLNDEILSALDTARIEHEFQFHSMLKLEKKLPLVRANRTHVRKALLNLLRNGIEAMEDAGIPLPQIIVTVRTVQNENIAQMTIQDNGPGLSEENIQRLFDPFFTTKDKGFGMGLAISRSLIEANGGQLWLDPEETPGATFHLTLPFAS